MNRPFLLTIAFAVLAFNATIAQAQSSTEILTWWGTPEPLLSPLAILGAASIAWIIAIWTIQENKKIQKRLTTIKYMSHLSWSDAYAPVRKIFLEQKAAKINFSKIAEDYHALSDKKNSKAGIKLDDDDKALISNHNAITKILNEYELMAVALKMGVYDEDIIKMDMAQIVLSDLRTCGTFIGTTRKKLHTKNEYPNPEAVYEKCCTLYKKWTGEELQIHS